MEEQRDGSRVYLRSALCINCPDPQSVGLYLLSLLAIEVQSMDIHETHTIGIELEGQLACDLVSEVEKQSVYIDTGLHQLKVGADRKRVVVTLETKRAGEICARL